MTKGGYEPTGPHRSPDVTITIIENDGTENEPIRLYQMYKIGEFDPLVDTFGNKETAEQVEARYKAELESNAAKYEEELRMTRMALAEVKGMVNVLAGKATAK
jgi:ABC-type hemin transport system substrate-binding protein